MIAAGISIFLLFKERWFKMSLREFPEPLVAISKEEYDYLVSAKEILENLYIDSIARMIDNPYAWEVSEKLRRDIEKHFGARD